MGERCPVGEGDASVPPRDRVSLAGGHTAHETAEEAQEETLKILELYREFAETELAMPVVSGEKSESEVRWCLKDLLD